MIKNISDKTSTHLIKLFEEKKYKDFQKVFLQLSSVDAVKVYIRISGKQDFNSYDFIDILQIKYL